LDGIIWGGENYFLWGGDFGGGVGILLLLGKAISGLVSADYEGYLMLGKGQI